MKASLNLLLLIFGLSLVCSADENGDQIRSYKTWSATRKLGLDLYNSLGAKQKPFIHVEPIALELDVMPAVKLSTFDDVPSGPGMLFITMGFFELMNNVAHAKAIDKVRKGYFEKYLLSLSQETGDKSLQELPDIDNPAFWTEDMMNEQLSNFNQMVGSLCAIKLTHYYLGHYKKYRTQILNNGGKRTPINSLLTTKEWDESLKDGIQSGLNCGFGIDGILALFEAIEKMKTRPEWTDYFMPRNVKVASMKKQFIKWEKDFFGGKR